VICARLSLGCPPDGWPQPTGTSPRALGSQRRGCLRHGCAMCRRTCPEAVTRLGATHGWTGRWLLRMVSTRVFGTSERPGRERMPSIDCPACDGSGYVKQEWRLLHVTTASMAGGKPSSTRPSEREQEDSIRQAQCTIGLTAACGSSYRSMRLTCSRMGGQSLAAVVAAGDGALAQSRLVETGGPAILTHPQPAEVLAAGRILAHD
jgi:hypothetical protein